MTELTERIEELARVPVLLVACDYDGTLAPIVEDPAEARPRRETLVALRALGTLRDTHVAVVSGRALRDLATLTGSCDELHLVGSHGSEFDLDFSRSIPAEDAQLLARVVAGLEEIAGERGGFLLETKPASVAFHFRNADPEEARRAVEEVLAGPASLAGVHTRHGKKVVELAVQPSNKGKALDRLRGRVGASAVLYLGDDLTDEDAFKTLAGPDLGVKVGPGESVAVWRVDDTLDVSRLLARLCEARETWLAFSAAVPIEQHALLSDQRAVALVTPDATISWLCLPRIDSQAVFAELLGGPSAGRFSVRPESGGASDGVRPEQSYRDDSMVLCTRWPELTVTDFFDCSIGRPRQRAGRSDLLRILEGKGLARIELAPRLDFGRIPTTLARHANGLCVENAVDPIVLRSPGVEWEVVTEGRHHTARALVDLDALGGRLVLDLRHGTGSLQDTSLRGPERRDLTTAYWSSWARGLALPSVEPELVRRSALVVKALCHAPSGAISAAATTSLPEAIGGVRNWDYRFCWLRDAALGAAALVELGSYDEAMHYLDWVLGVVDACASPSRLHPLYSVTGESVHPEGEIGDLAGYRGSRPVRVGNTAAQQVQLDVFGPIVDLVHRLIERDAPLSADHWRLVEAMARAVAERWSEPDHGIWEERLPMRHHVHSKVMCWLTLDRAVDIGRTFLEHERADWIDLRDRIAADVLEHGWNPRLEAFSGSYGEDYLDASVLHVGFSGLLEPGDPRFVRTVEAIERGLREDPTVYRYRFDDGLPGFEGGFHVCASWLVDAYLLVGRRDDARALFEKIVACAGPTGLLSEQIDPRTGDALGNHPQVYSHLGVILNAVHLGRE